MKGMQKGGGKKNKPLKKLAKAKVKVKNMMGC